MADIQFNFNAKDLDEIKKLMDELLKISETISKNLATVGKYSEDDVKQLKKLTAEMKKLSAEKKKAELSTKQQAKAEADLANIEQKSAGRRAVNAKKIQNDLDAQEIRTRKIAIAQENLNNKIAKAGTNTNTWGKALDSFQFKFNALGNIAGMLSGQMSNLATIIGGKLLDSAGSFFTKTEKGMELMERKTAGFNAAMDVLNGKFAELGDAMSGNQDEAIRWGTLLQTILNNFGVVGDVAGIALKGTTDEMDSASVEADKLAQSLQDLEEQERKLREERAAQNLVIQEARSNIAENIGTQEEQLAGLKKAVEFEKIKAADEKRFAIAKNDIIRQQIALQQRSGIVNDEQKDKLIQMAIEEMNIEYESLKRTQKASRQILTLEKQINDAKGKSNDEKSKLDKEYDDAYIKILEDERLAEQQKYDDDLRAYNEKLKAKEDLDKEYDDAYIQILEDEKKEAERIEIDSAKKIADELQAIEERKARARQALSEASFTLALSFIDMLGARNNAQMEQELKDAEGNEKKQEEIKRKYLKRDQNFAIMAATINTAEAITKIWAKNAYSVPVAIALSAIAAATLGTQVAAIKAQKFAKGGEVGGLLHSQGGTHIEAERGEYVINRKSVGKYRGLIEGINEDNQMKMMEAMGRDKHLNIVNKQDIYTKKLYEHLVNQEVYGETPNFYVVQKGTKKTMIRK